MNTNLLTPKQLAVKLGLHENTLAKWRLYGGGPAYIKIQRHVRYAESNVETWLNERTFQSTTEADHYALIWKEAA